MADSDEVTTRDLATLGQDGPQLTQFETASARGIGQQRPAFSPVAQPGMNEEIWYHTVETDRAARTQARRPTRGMIGRLNRPQQETIVIDGGRRRRGGGGGDGQ